MSARRWGVAAALCSVAASVFAATPRTFVASYGSDANPCSVTSPCRSFNAALAQTSVGGEVIVLDSAGYGPMTITQSVSIIAPMGVYAGISVFSSDGITINGAGAKVVLRNLALTGLGGANGIVFQNGAELIVERCSIANFPGTGIYDIASASKTSVVDSLVRTSGTGIAVHNASFPPPQAVSLVRARLFTNGTGFSSRSSWFDANRSVISANTSYGVAADEAVDGGIVDSLLSDNTTANVRFGAGNVVSGSFAVAGNTITRGGYGVHLGPTQLSIAYVVATRDAITQNSADGIYVFGPGVNGGPGTAAVANENTFSRNGGFALNSDGLGIMKTVKGADGLPNNAGEQTTPTNGATVVVNPF